MKKTYLVCVVHTHGNALAFEVVHVHDSGFATISRRVD
jgi:hypothetical protein